MPPRRTPARGVPAWRSRVPPPPPPPDGPPRGGRHAEPRVLREPLEQGCEEPQRPGRRAEVAHVPGRHLVECAHLIGPEGDGDALLLRAPHLPPHVGGQALPHAL